jgi:hypothetical protein
MADLTLPGGTVIEDKTKGFDTLADVINNLVPYIFPLAGLAFFFMLIGGGFQLLTSAGNPESTKKGYQKILFAFIGFIVIFIAYWVVQILEHIFGITVFNA